jgi:hypothetical protein
MAFRQAKMSVSQCRTFIRSAIFAGLSLGVGVAENGAAHPDWSIPEVTPPLTLEAGGLDAKVVGQLERYAEAATTDSGTRSIVRLILKGVRTLEDTPSSNRVQTVSRLANFFKAIGKQSILVAPLQNYLAEFEGHQEITNSTASTKILYYTLEAISWLSGDDNSLFDRLGIRAPIEDWANRLKSDIATLEAIDRPTRTPVDVEYNHEASDQSGLTAEQTALLGEIERYLEESLAVWEHIPIDLPPSEFAGEGAIVSERDTFVALPEFDEDIAYGEDDAGNRRRLLLREVPGVVESLKETGRFFI